MEQVRVGVIGVGGRGHIAENWHRPDQDSVVVAGADVSEEQLQSFQQKVNAEAFITTDYRELLERKDIDAVAITSPDFCHEEHAVAALQAGKHVFCEKPLAIKLKGVHTQCAFREEIDVEDNNMLIMELEGGIKASYMQCHFAPDYHRNYTFIGTEGRLENSEPDNKVYVKTRRSNTWRELADRTYDIKQAEGGHGGADPVITNDFIQMILNNTDPLASPLAGRMSVAVGCAATESIRTGGQPVVVSPIPSFLSDEKKVTGINRNT